MPMRDVIHGDSDINGSIPIEELKRMVHCRVLVARSVIFLIDNDARVQFYTEQSYTIRYQLGEKKFHYIPFLLVTWHRGKPSLFACEAETPLRHQKHAPQWTVAQVWCARHKDIFSLTSDSVLRRCDTLLPNLEFLGVHARQALPSPACEYLLITPASMVGTWSVVVERTPRLQSNFTKSYIWNLLCSWGVSDRSHETAAFRTKSNFVERSTM